MALSQSATCPSFILYKDDVPVGRGALTSCFFDGRHTPSFLTLQSLMHQDSNSKYIAKGQKDDQGYILKVNVDKGILRTCAFPKIAHFKVLPKKLKYGLPQIFKTEYSLCINDLLQRSLKVGNLQYRSLVKILLSPDEAVEGKVEGKEQPMVQTEGKISSSLEKGAAVVNESGELVAIVEEKSENGRYKIIPISDYSLDFDEERLNVCHENEAKNVVEKCHANCFLPKEEEAGQPEIESLQGSGNPVGLLYLGQDRFTSLGGPSKLQQGPKENLEGPYPPGQRQYHSLGDLPNLGQEQNDPAEDQIQPEPDRHCNVAGLSDVLLGINNLEVDQQEEQDPQEACKGRHEPEKEKFVVPAGYKIGSMDVNVIHLIAMLLDSDDRWESLAVELGFENKIDQLDLCHAGGGRPALAFLHQLVATKPNEILSALKKNISSIGRDDVSSFIDNNLGDQLSNKIIEVRDNYYDKFSELASKLEKGKDVKKKYWRNLAPLYGFDDATISGIQSTIRSNQQYSPTEKIVILLKQQRPGYKVVEFVEALRSRGFGDAVEIVENYFEEKEKLRSEKQRRADSLHD